MKAHFTRIFIVLTTITVFTGACGQQNGNDGKSQARLQQMQENRHAEQPVDQSKSERVRKQIMDRDAVTEVHAVNSKTQLMVAIQLKTMQQFNAQQIVEQVKKSIAHRYPNMKVEVSSDKKVYMEVSELEANLQTHEVSQKQFDKKLKRIARFMKEQKM
ncbi:MAG TPA: YhcN/YlaJ family sporulation lipoprotein [Bacillales bacterium]|nr:YhcN/YlaJ family sporulation lipoprotein [Bacillales bacterium]